MKRTLMFAMGAVVLFTAAACQQAPPAATQPAPPSPVERGKYLVNAIGCNDCHTPMKMGPNGPEPDMNRMLSGHPETMKITANTKLPEGVMAGVAPTFTAWYGPWGVSFTANLTPDQNTGLGIWTEEMFVKAIREGKHMGQSRPILPPMPWQAFRNLNDDDLKSIYAYLRTIPAISNHVPDPIPPAEAPAAKK